MLALGPAFAPVAATAQDRPVVTVGQTFIAAVLDPAEGPVGWAVTSHGVAEKVFTVARDGGVEPQLATSAERTGDLTSTVTLADGRVFSDRAPVTAAAVAKALDPTGAADPDARASAGWPSATATGPLTLAIATDRPIPVPPSALAARRFRSAGRPVPARSVPAPARWRCSSPVRRCASFPSRTIRAPRSGPRSTRSGSPVPRRPPSA